MTITIRRTKPSDAPAVRAIYKDKAVYYNMAQLPMPSMWLWQERLSDIPDNVYSLVAVINGEVVGNLGLMVSPVERRRHVAEFGVGVKASAQGQGVGKALITAACDLADNWLNLKRIEITVFTDNKGAIKLYKKLGFVIEAEMSDFTFRNGEYMNAYQMARVRKN